MASLPLIEADRHEIRDWLQPAEVREVFRRQPRFIRPDLASLRRTLLFTLAPASYFLGHVLPKATRAGQALSCSVWALLCLTALAAAAFRNPGVVPRAVRSSGDGVNGVPAARFVTVNGVSVKQRWCTTCRVYRPLRSKHCSYCDRCVFRFDHHCTWLGNCVGLGNYRSFLVLVVAATSFFGQSAVIALQVLRKSCAEVAEGDAKSCIANVLRRYCFTNGGKLLYVTYAFAMCAAFSVLLLYHLVITGCNLTTNEHVRDYYLQRNPFDVTCVENYQQVLCSPYGRRLPDEKADSTQG
mmetsp:Transcript_80520/g.142067  ORF Transcript_80520/g.142067 Transcript_80520/m.142067 type:complete len:297 (+) Transcript_80520:68-958(+)